MVCLLQLYIVACFLFLCSLTFEGRWAYLPHTIWYGIYGVYVPSWEARITYVELVLVP